MAQDSPHSRLSRCSCRRSLLACRDHPSFPGRGRAEYSEAMRRGIWPCSQEPSGSSHRLSLGHETTLHQKQKSATACRDALESDDRLHRVQVGHRPGRPSKRAMSSNVPTRRWPKKCGSSPRKCGRQAAAGGIQELRVENESRPNIRSLVGHTDRTNRFRTTRRAGTSNARTGVPYQAASEYRSGRRRLASNWSSACVLSVPGLIRGYSWSGHRGLRHGVQAGEIVQR